jgi:hypothetical protein
MTTVADPFDPAAVPEPDSRKAPEPEPEMEAEPEAKDEGSTYFVFRAYTESKAGEPGKLVPVTTDFYLEGELWQCVGTYTASNGPAAIRKAIKENWSDENGHPRPEADGHYATVPARSWGPIPVGVKQPPASISIGGQG